MKHNFKANVTINKYDSLTLPNAVRVMTDISASSKLILASILSFELGGKECSMSNSELAKQNGMSTRTVANCMDQLEDRGLVIRNTRLKSDGTKSRTIHTCIGVVKGSKTKSKLPPTGLFEDI